MDIKEFNNYVNRVNECLNVSKSTIEVNTLHLVITKIAFNILRKKGKISESQDKVERLGKINYAVDTPSDAIVFLKFSITSFIIKPLLVLLLKMVSLNLHHSFYLFHHKHNSYYLKKKP